MKYYYYYDHANEIFQCYCDSPEHVESLPKFKAWVGTAPTLHDPREGYLCPQN